MKDLMLFLSIHVTQHADMCLLDHCHSGGVGVFVSSRLKQNLQFVKAVDDTSYLWLKLKDVVLGCPELSFCVCYMPQKSDFRKIRHHTTVPIHACRMML